VGSVRFLSTHYSANLGCAFGVDFRPGFGVWAGQVEGEAREHHGDRPLDRRAVGLTRLPFIGRRSIEGARVPAQLSHSNSLEAVQRQTWSQQETKGLLSVLKRVLFRWRTCDFRRNLPLARIEQLVVKPGLLARS
jgi:hypothetical protein